MPPKKDNKGGAKGGKAGKSEDGGDKGTFITIFIQFTCFVYKDLPLLSHT